MGGGHLEIRAAQIGTLAPFLAQQLGHPVIDKTGVTEKYDIKLQWQQDASAPTAMMDSPQSSAPSLFTALEEQLGLKLAPHKGPISVIVVDSAHKPSIDGAEVQTDSASAGPGPAPSASAAAITPTITFDVASVRESKQDPNLPHMVGGSFQPHSTHLRLVNVQIYYLVEMAYGVDVNQVEGIPDWGWTSFDVEAKSDTEAD